MSETQNFDYDTFAKLLTGTTAKDELVLYILFKLVGIICVKDGDSYIFGLDAETPENEKLVNKYFEATQKLIPHSSTAYVKKSQKKVYIYIRHLCKNLEHLNVIMTTKTISVIKDTMRSTKNLHYIDGLI